MKIKSISRRDFLKAAGIASAGSVLVACAPAATPTTAGEQQPTEAQAEESPTQAPAEVEENAELVFSWWGSPYEKETGEKMLASFTESTGIKTTPMHIPTDYMQKMLTMAAANTLPDVFYLSYTDLVTWAQKSLILDLTDLYSMDPEANLDNIVEVNHFQVGGKIFGTGACTEPMMMFYNKQVFDDAQVPYPPAKAEDAWTWDKFLEVCRQLTVDENGLHPTDAGFDSENIKTYAADIVRWGGSWQVYAPYLWSQGSDVYSEDLNSLFPDVDLAIETIQKIADISAKEHVHPSPDFYSASGMDTTQMLQTGKMAMQVTGNWSLEAISQSEFSYGEAVAPKMGDDYVIWANSDAIGMRKTTQYPDAAWKLYKWVVFGEGSLALSRTGLWQPQRVDLLTTEEGRSTWMDPKVHTADHATAACLPAVNNARIIPARLGQSEWQDKYLTPALDPVYQGKQSAEEAIKAVLPEINKYLVDNPNWQG